MAFVGIDLGTTTSEIAVYEDGKARVIRDREGNQVVESLFGFVPETKQPAVGETVKDFLKKDADLCVEQVKRRMGESASIRVGDQDYRPEEISANILRHMKKAAENDLNEEIDRAVITVPANFPDTARRATKKAGEIAGLTVERIINEPTAAALAFGQSEEVEEEKVMVYDLGGGTFDVSVVEYMGPALDVMASAGDPHLGGKDFDEALLGYVAEEFETDTGISIDKNSKQYYNLLFACEEAKKKLSFNQKTTVSLPFVTVKDGEPISLDVEVTRAKFESLISDDVDRTERAINKALKEAGIESSGISRVLLVGGSTRIPYVREMVERVIGQRPVSSVDPDRAVALGAATQSAIIGGETDQIIMDVCPLSLGTCAVVDMGGTLMPGHYTEIIEPNWKVLKPSSDTFHTVVENQGEVDFKVYQRNSMSDSDWAEVDDEPNDGYTLLGSKEIEIPEGPAGQEIEATYTYNQDGLIDVEIELAATGEKIPFQVGSDLDDADIEASRQKIEQTWQESEYLEDVEALLHAAEKEINSDMEDQKRKEVEQAVDQLKRALAKNEKAEVERYEEKVTDLLFDIGL